MSVIGLGGQGTRDMNDYLRFPDTQIVALCDMDAGSTRYEQGWYRGLAPAREMVQEHYSQRKSTRSYSAPDGYADFREVLAQEDIDAVPIGTPDH